MGTERKKIFAFRSPGIFVFFPSLLLFLFFSISGFKRKASPEPPNIVVMLVDDAGYADFGFMGATDLQTPNLDALAARSVLFTDAHVTASVCSPSRAGLLTGKYQQRFGYECNEGEGFTGIDTAQQLFPAYLRGHGYKTAAFGKWHLGYQPGQHPLRRGFDYYYGFLSGGRSYFYQPDKDDRPGNKNALQENGQPVSFKGYLTDVLGDQAAAFIRENRQRPFFMYWAPNAVHTPMEASEADMKKFEGHPRQKLAAMTFALDRAVGKIISELKTQGLFENTLIFFLSDNGGAHNNQSLNGPLKGFKGNEFEAGHRVPFLLSWPDGLAAGIKFSGLSSALDIAPTVLQAAGIKGYASYNLDGVNLLPFLKSKKNKNPHPQLVWRKDAFAAIRVGPYKLIRAKDAGERLYNLRSDPGETRDLQKEKPKKHSELQGKLLAWEKDKQRPAWTEGADWDTITLMIHDDLMQNRKVRVRNPEELEKFREGKPTH